MFCGASSRVFYPLSRRPSRSLSADSTHPHQGHALPAALHEDGELRPVHGELLDGLGRGVATGKQHGINGWVRRQALSHDTPWTLHHVDHTPGQLAHC